MFKNSAKKIGPSLVIFNKYLILKARIILSLKLEQQKYLYILLVPI